MRRAAVAAGLVLALLGLALTFLWAWSVSAVGTLQGGDPAAAARSFHRQGAATALFPEPWKAPFNEGTAHLTAGRYVDASDALQVALTRIGPAAGPVDPAGNECLIRVNLSLTLEARGAQAADPAAAASLYGEALDVIGPCTSDGESAAGSSDRPVPEPGNRADLDEQRIWDKRAEAGSGANPEGEAPESPESDEGGAADQINELDARNRAANQLPPRGSGTGTGENW